MIEILKSIRLFFVALFVAFINIIVKFISLFIKKDENLVIIGGWFGDRWADNSRYLFIDSLYQKKYKVYYITNDKNVYLFLKDKYNCIMKWSIKSFYYHLKAKYHIIDQNCKSLLGYLSVNAIRINLWHGIPLKKIWILQDNKRKNALAQRIMNLYFKLREKSNGYCSKGKWDIFYIVCPSNETWINYFSKCLFSSKSKPLFCRYPRTDYLIDYKNNIMLNEEKKYVDVLLKYKDSGKKILFYVPTFRDNHSTKFLGCDNIDEINKYLKLLKDNNCVLVTKMHSADKSNIDIKNQNILFLDKLCDITTFLPYSDALITDYSSVYFDYLVLDRPILFFPYDYEYYKNNDRGFFTDYNDSTPGVKSFDINQLYVNTKKLIDNNFNDKYKEERNNLRKKIIDKQFPNLFEAIGDIKL